MRWLRSRMLSEMLQLKRACTAFKQGRRSLHVCLLAGEPSGDEIGAHLIHSLQSILPTTDVPNNRSSSNGSSIPPLTFTGVGGHHMSMASPSFRSLFPMSDLTAMGTTELMSKLPLFFYRGYQVVRHVVQERPDVVVTIDSKGFNTRVVDYAQRWISYSDRKNSAVVGVDERLRGGRSSSSSNSSKRKMNDNTDRNKQGNRRPKYVHYVAPSVWAFKKTPNNTHLSTLYDRLCVILPFEQELFQHDLPTTYVGHPSIDSFMNHIGVDPKKNGIRVEKDDNDDTPLLATLRGNSRGAGAGNSTTKKDANALHVLLLPGSRLQELKKMMPLMHASVDLYEAAKDRDTSGRRGSTITPVVVSSSSPDVEAWLGTYVQEWNQQRTQDFPSRSPVVLVQQRLVEKYQALQIGDVALATSGTVVTELGLLGIPTTVVYSASPLTEHLARKMAAVQSLSLINIMHEFSSDKKNNRGGGKTDRLVTELLFEDCTSTNMAAELSTMLQECNRDDINTSNKDMQQHMDRLYDTLLPPRPSPSEQPSQPPQVHLHRPSYVAALAVAQVAGVGGLTNHGALPQLSQRSQRSQQRHYSSTPHSSSPRHPKNNFTFQTSSPLVTVLGGIVLFTGAGLMLLVGGTFIGLGVLGVLAAVAWRKITGKPMGGGEAMYHTINNMRKKEGATNDPYNPEKDQLLQVLHLIIQDSPAIRTNFPNQTVSVGQHLRSQIQGLPPQRQTLKCEYALVSDNSGGAIGTIIVVGGLLKENKGGLAAIVHPKMTLIQSVSVVQHKRNNLKFDLSIPIELLNVKEAASGGNAFSNLFGSKKKEPKKSRGERRSRRNGNGGSGHSSASSGNSGEKKSGTVIDIQDFKEK